MLKTSNSDRLARNTHQSFAEGTLAGLRRDSFWGGGGIRVIRVKQGQVSGSSGLGIPEKEVATTSPDYSLARQGGGGYLQRDEGAQTREYFTQGRQNSITRLGETCRNPVRGEL